MIVVHRLTNWNIVLTSITVDHIQCACVLRLHTKCLRYQMVVHALYITVCKEFRDKCDCLCVTKVTKELRGGGDCVCMCNLAWTARPIDDLSAAHRLSVTSWFTVLLLQELLSLFHLANLDDSMMRTYHIMIPLD